MDSSQDYYTILGVERDATPGEIRAAFKRLALKYHPDVYKGDDAHERMRLLLLAYKTLNDATARKEYDVRLYRRQNQRGYALAGSASPSGQRQEATPGARRDRRRHYAFPIFQGDGPVTVDLNVFLYRLSTREVLALEQQGMLRGVAPENNKQAYFCHRCHFHWYVTPTRGKPERWDVPRHCPQCNAWDWPEYLLLYCHHCGAVFESEQIRYEVGRYTYGKNSDTDLVALCPPYELFPLCPYCGAAHWCPAEEERVEDLRRRAAYRETLLRFVLFGVAAAMMVVIGVVVLSGLH